MSGNGANALWNVTQSKRDIDAKELAAAIEEAANDESADFRTRLLLRDSINALQDKWGARKLDQWVSASPARKAIEVARKAQFDETGFPSLPSRIVSTTKPDTVIEFLREASLHVTEPTHIVIGGAIALIMRGMIERHTEDVDVVDEVPAHLRNQRELLHDLSKRYGLHLAHFQSHYLPNGWEQRVRSLMSFGQLRISLIDEYDALAGKLFSSRARDLDDLRAAKALMDRTVLVQRLRDSSAALRSEAKLLAAAEKNWFVLFGEELPE